MNVNDIEPKFSSSPGIFVMGGYPDLYFVQKYSLLVQTIKDVFKHFKSVLFCKEIFLVINHGYRG